MVKQSLWRIHLPLMILGFLAADTAQAAGYYMSSVGTRAYSRGGAFIAGADNLLAMYHNPAALIRLDRPQFMLDVAGVQQGEGEHGAGALRHGGQRVGVGAGLLR